MIGEVKTGLELGKPFSRRYHKYIYHACVDCGLERWTTYDHNEVQSPRCKACENRFKAKHNPALYKTGVGSGLSPEERNICTPEWRDKISKSLTGKVSPLRGIKRPDIAKEKHPMWKGGITSESEIQRKSLKYIEWRNAVYNRDNYTCQRCGIKGAILNAHHIKFWEDYPELRFELTNGITYCHACHRYIHVKAKIFDKLEKEFQTNRRKVLILRLDVLEKYNTPDLIRVRKSFQSYNIEPQTLQPLPKKKSKESIIKEIQLSFFKGGDES